MIRERAKRMIQVGIHRFIYEYKALFKARLGVLPHDKTIIPNTTRHLLTFTCGTKRSFPFTYYPSSVVPVMSRLPSRTINLVG
jgi:hypothetical protein